MRHRCSLIILAMVALFFVCGDGQAQSPAAEPMEQTDNAANGLTLNSKGERVTELDKAIYYVFQARDNTYWFGSNERGVYRYDGRSLVNFTTKDGLVSNRIRGIAEDKVGNIYFTTYEGISRFDGQAFSTMDFFPTKFWEKRPDDLWFVGPPNTGTVYRHDGKSLYRLELPKSKMGEELIERFRNPRFPDSFLNPYDVYTISQDRDGNIWFGTACAGACRFDGKAFTWLYEDHLTNIEGGGSFGIRSILEDKSGAFWICNTRFRFRVEGQDGPVPNKADISYQREQGIELRAPDGKDHVYFMSAVEDDEGALWLASGRFGVWRFFENRVTHFPVRDGTADVSLFSIYRDNRGVLWLGTLEAGVYRFDGQAFVRFRP